MVGASGGGFIIAGTAEVVLNHFAKGMDPFSSVMAPRVYHRVCFIASLLYLISFLLGTMTLHNGIILSSLNISSCGFAFGFSKKFHTNRDNISWLWIIFLISQYGTPSQQSLTFPRQFT